MTDNQPNVLTPEQIAMARDITGESRRGSFDQRPSIKFLAKDSEHGKAGQFHLCTKNPDTGQMEYQNLGDTIEATIVRIRKSADNGNNEPYVWIREADSFDDQVELQIDGEPDIRVGKYLDFKAEYGLTYREVLYLYFKGQLVKMKIRGLSISPFWEYLDSIPKNDSVIRYITRFGSEERKTSFGKTRALTFSLGPIEPKYQSIVTAAHQLQLTQVRKPKALPAPGPEDATSADPMDIENLPF